MVIPKLTAGSLQRDTTIEITRMRSIGRLQRDEMKNLVLVPGARDDDALVQLRICFGLGKHHSDGGGVYILVPVVVIRNSRGQ